MQSFLRRTCLNPKVIAALALAAVAIVVFAPGAFVTALPFLLVAACPLSMLLMGGAMKGGRRDSDEPALTDSAGLAEEVARLHTEVETLRSQMTNNDRREDSAGVAK